MNKKLIPMVTVAFLLALMPAFASAQSTGATTGPDSDITIVCDADYYSPDVLGNIDIYCDIINSGGSTKNEKVGSVFDDYTDINGDDYEVQFSDVLIYNGTDWNSIKPNMNTNKPEAKKTKQLSNQNIQTDAGQTTQVWFQVKVPMGSSGKFDVVYGEGLGEYKLDPWWNVSWQYKACWNLSGHTDNFTSVDINRYPYGYPFNVTLNTQSLIGSAKMNSDCSDLRLTLDDTTEIPFFLRDCDETVSEVWGATNFTIGESYDICVYYGNSGASNAESNRFDIVYAYEDFDDHAFSWSRYTNYTAWEPGRTAPYAAINTSGGDGLFTVWCSQNGNCGFRVVDESMWSDDNQILTDMSYLYRSPGTEWYTGEPLMYLQADNTSHPEMTQGSGHYVQCLQFNCTRFELRYRSSNNRDFEWIGYNSTVGGEDYWAANTSNYYSTNGQFTQMGMILNYDNCTSGYSTTPRNDCLLWYGNYTGQPYKDRIPLPVNADSVWSCGTDEWCDGIAPSQDMFDSWGGNTTLSWGGSMGAWNTVTALAEYSYWFARPWYEGEPLATGGAEIPLDNGTLDISFVSPTPANGSTVGTPTVIINVSANKTIEECWLDFDGTNYSMTTDTTYCWKEQVVDGTTRDYKVFVEDLWGYTEQTGESTITGSDYSALLAVGADVADFNFSSSDYVTGYNVSFNTSLTTTDIIIMSSLNVLKLSGVGSNSVWAKLIVDGNTEYEGIIRTVDTIGEDGSTGIPPIPVSLSAGSHYIQLDFKRTGDGIINIHNVDLSAGQFVTTSGGVVNGSLTSGNFTHTDTSYAQAENITLGNLAFPLFTSTYYYMSSNDSNTVWYQVNYSTTNVSASFSDDFSAGNLNNWDVSTGSWTATNNYLESSADSSVIFSNGRFDMTNTTITWRMKNHGTGSFNDQLHIYLANGTKSDVWNDYSLNVRIYNVAGAGGGLRLSYRYNSVSLNESILYPYDFFATAGQWYNFKMYVNDTDWLLKIWNDSESEPVNWTSSINLTSGFIPSATLQPFCRYTSGAGCGYDDFTVDASSMITVNSPYSGRYLSSASSVGAISTPYLDTFPQNANLSLMAKNVDASRSTDVNYSMIWFELEDNFTKDITNFQISNENTSDIYSVNISDTYTLLTNYTRTVEIGDGYFMGMSATAQSNSGAQTITYKVNATGATCSSEKDRYLADNTDLGNIYIYFICDNLTATSSYDFQLWAKAGTGESFDQFDESFSGFETQSFDITSGNLPPFPGIITNPANASDQTTEVNVTWTAWSDPNSNFDDYNVSLLNGDGSYNSTITDSTSNLYAVIDISGLPSGATFGAEVNGCDTEPLCSNQTVYFNVENVPEYSNFAGDPETTNFTAEADLANVTDPVLANSYAKVEWSGSGYDAAGADFDSYVIYGSNLASVDTTTFPTFDRPATITLKGVTYSSTVAYRVLDDGVECTTCVKLSATPATFTVPGFSNYTTSSVPATETQPLLALIPLIIAVALVMGFVGAFVSGLLDLQMMIIWVIIAAIAMTFIAVIFFI